MKNMRFSLSCGFFTDVHLQQEKNAVAAFDKAIQKINQLQPDFVISGGAVCANWWDGPHQGIEEGFLLVSVEENNFTWEYIDYGWDADKN